MRRRLPQRGRGFLWGLLLGALAVVGAVPVRAADDVPDVDPTSISDPVERKFYQELRELRLRQKQQRQELANQDLPPQERLEKRRAMLVREHQELQDLENAYQPKLSPEARSRWMERKANREKRFEKLQQGESSSKQTKSKESGRNRKKAP